jgi:AcrR family transcriptional regulator
MPTTTNHTRRDGEATRQRLLRAALDLYTTIGFRATTTPAIAARAGVAEGTIYRHFSGKEHLLNEVYRNAQQWGAGVVREPGESAAGVPERLRAIARRLLEAAASDAPTARMLLRRREEQHLDERSRDASREFRATLGAVMAEGASAGAIRSGPADLWADLWLALVTFAAERVAAREWTLESPEIGLTVAAAWDAVAARS